MSRGRTLGLGAPPRLPPGPRLAPGPESGLTLPGHRPPGPAPARALGSSPAGRSLPSLPAEPGPAGLPGRGAADTARRGSGRLPSAEVPPAAGHAPGPQREVPAATARQDGELWRRRGDGALLDRGWDARESWPHQTCLVRRLSSVLQTVNHNTKRFRFALPTAHHVLGLPVGKKRGVGSFSWNPDRVAPLLGSPAPHSCLLVPSHSVPFPHQGADPPGCKVPWATLGVAPVPPDIFSTLHSPLFSAGFQQILPLSKLCPSPHCPEPQLSTKVLAVADKSFCRGQLLRGPAGASKG